MSKDVRDLKSLYGGKLRGGSHKVKRGGAIFMGELIPQLFYQNYLFYQNQPLLVYKEFYDMHYLIFLLIKTS